MTFQAYLSTAGLTLSALLAFVVLWLYLKSKRIQARLNELAKKDLERSKEVIAVKSNYFSILSHELRTPIFAITGLARLMDDPCNRTEENFEAITNSGNHLLHLVNNVLQHRKLEESESIILDEHDFDLRKILEEVLQTTSYLANQKDIVVVVDSPENLDFHLFGDKHKLVQILINLVSNAIRYSHQNGEVKISVRMTEVSKNSRTFHFSIRDNGIGIQAAQISTLFDYHGATFITNREEEANRKGMGIGLFIASRYIAAMNGKLSVNSEPGEGSDFNFPLTFKAGKCTAVCKEPMHMVEKSLTILVVDDIKINLIVSQKIINALGLRCLITTDSNPVVDIIKRESVHLVLTDLNMPMIDGYELSRRIRRAGFSIPIIAHTAVVKENIDHEILAAAGITDLLVKPYSIEEIKCIMTKYLGVSF